ncbi:hypothetical protein PENSPDRAFT_429897 [Peniophora sp. CONT]|nr:hypothetical protein PENSPDRAFT_429897 [Peniophora sp. CONT]
MHRDALKPNYHMTPCRYYAQGKCKKGDACNFVREATAQPTNSSPHPMHGPSHDRASRNAGLPRHDGRPVSQQRETGPDTIAQRKAEAKEAAARRREAAAAARREAREARELAERERRKATAKQELERLTEKAREDATVNVQHLIMGSAVTFQAGLAIRDYTTGYESSIVRVRNLPSDAQEREIRDLFTQQGVDPAKILLLSNRLVDGTREAKVLLDAEVGKTIAVGLDGIEFRDRDLSIDISEYHSPDKMGYGIMRDADVLSVSWRSPTVRYVVSYPSAEIARQRIQRLDGMSYHGRKLRFEVNQTPPGHSFYVDPGSVKISNLPSSVTDETVRNITWPDALTVRRLPSKVKIEEPLVAARMLYDLLKDSWKNDWFRRALISFDDTTDDANESKGVASFNLQFRSWEEAKFVYDFLKDRKLSFLGDAACWLRLPLPISYVITLSVEQHRAQRKYWDALLLEFQGWNTDECSLSISDVMGKPLVRVRALGSSAKVVGFIKTRVEKIAAGQKVEGWHPGIGRLESDFASRVLAQTGAYMRADWREKQIKLYGRTAAIYSARRMVQAELARLGSLERMTTIPRYGVRFFLTKGLAELQEMCGKEAVHLDPATLILTTPNSDKVLHAVSRLIGQSKSQPRLAGTLDMLCPICLCDVDTPIVLGCGHATCSSCLQHLATSASGTTKYPLTCMGNNAKCGTPIPIPYIQRFLTPAMFLKLLKSIFVAYIAQHPHRLRYCQTPDCEQVYRVTSRPRTVDCPACLASLCSACHAEDGHDGISCRESRLQRDPVQQERLAEEWMMSQGGRVKKCPRCSVLMEKVDGCNHMSCYCGAHICWTCGRDFHADDIYPHLNSAHGGIIDVRQ